MAFTGYIIKEATGKLLLENGGGILIEYSPSPLDVLTAVRAGQNATVTFSFASADHYAISVDGGAFTTQSSPYTAAGCGAGSHRFTVQALDANNDVIAQSSVALTQSAALISMALLLGIL